MCIPLDLTCKQLSLHVTLSFWLLPYQPHAPSLSTGEWNEGRRHFRWMAGVSAVWTGLIMTFSFTRGLLRLRPHVLPEAQFLRNNLSESTGCA